MITPVGLSAPELPTLLRDAVARDGPRRFCRRRVPPEQPDSRTTTTGGRGNGGCSRLRAMVGRGRPTPRRVHRGFVVALRVPEPLAIKGTTRPGAIAPRASPSRNPPRHRVPLRLASPHGTHPTRAAAQRLPRRKNAVHRTEHQRRSRGGAAQTGQKLLAVPTLRRGAPSSSRTPTARTPCSTPCLNRDPTSSRLARIRCRHRLPST